MKTQPKPKRSRARSAEDISNDISEGLPVTPAELRRCLRWERARTLRLQVRINALRDAMVRAGLTLALDHPRIEAVRALSTALRTDR